MLLHRNNDRSISRRDASNFGPWATGAERAVSVAGGLVGTGGGYPEVVFPVCLHGCVSAAGWQRECARACAPALPGTVPALRRTVYFLLHSISRSLYVEVRFRGFPSRTPPGKCYGQCYGHDAQPRNLTVIPTVE